ncbi:two-component system, OmpR family, heavy metal sensor histidine kinase CusS [Nitrosovibrio tenuis]|uniref:Sensor protein n=2 Tax=Nitrosovibrio tenuis TaxID=1233 RepID=A0A1H7LUS6_9PROT|nr:two-component system, OmpR family, heavy metal sensor histidine kinase CusS [Nitrosovibrio tenuis]
MLIFTSGFLYWVLITTLEQEDEQILNSRLQVLDLILRAGNIEALEREIAEENVGFPGSQYLTYSRVLDESGHTLYEAPGMNREIPPAVFPDSGASTGKTKEWRSATNRSYLLVARQTGGGDTRTLKRQIQVALDETSEEMLISRYEQYLIGVLLAVILGAAAIGIITARRGMKPLEDLTWAAERITASQLHERIDVAHWPRELVSLARAFDGMLVRLEDSFNRLSQFSADLAHELRTPINNLRGEAEVALSRPREAKEYREILASSLEEYGRLSRMIDSLLFLAKADSVQATVTCLPLDARAEIEKVIAFYEALAAEQDVRVICEGNGTIMADPILFRRVISNLLSNALHYTPAGGKISFSVHCIDGGMEVICCDSGTGIVQEHLPKIFDRFYRVSPSRSSTAEGAGLGLAIVKSIVGLHRGKIAVQSAVGKGTSVRIFFPAQPIPS